MEEGGNKPCILNAANEVAVDAFLKDDLSYLAMPEIIEECLQKISYIKQPSYEDYVDSDKETRVLAGSLL